MLPLTTKTRTTTNLKTKNNQNCQKIELYGSLTTKELKKKHSSKLVGRVETCSLSGKDIWKGGGSRSRWSHICMRINWEEQLGRETDHTTQGSIMGGKKPLKPWAVKPSRVEVEGELPASQESWLERRTGS